MKKIRIIGFLLTVTILFVNIQMPVCAADIETSSPSVLLMEASTGKIIYEKNATERRSLASVTKIMTLLLIFEALEEGKISLSDEVITSQYASSMGGSQVFLAEGETQSVDTLIKCITVASGNDSSVAMAEYICGTEEAFVEKMNSKAAMLGMVDTHFVDCCGLTDSDDHYSSAKDIAIMSRELIYNYPAIYDYTQIWMEDITHVTKQGESTFTLSNTNKLLKQFQWTTGLKTGSTSKARLCISATARKDGMDMIAVVLGAEDNKARFGDAKTLLSYGFNTCKLYVDEETSSFDPIPVWGGMMDYVNLTVEESFRYLDTEGILNAGVEKNIDIPEKASAPICMGDVAGQITYSVNGVEIGKCDIIYSENVEKAGLLHIYLKEWKEFLL